METWNAARSSRFEMSRHSRYGTVCASGRSGHSRGTGCFQRQQAESLVSAVIRIAVGYVKARSRQTGLNHACPNPARYSFADGNMVASLIHYLTGIQFGTGAVSALPALLAQHGISRPLLVTDQGLVELGVPDRLPLEPAAMFAEVPTYPTEASCVAGAAVYLDHGCDGIIGLGGGSPIDCAKAISILATHPGPLDQYALIRGGRNRICPEKPPVLAVPSVAQHVM